MSSNNCNLSFIFSKTVSLTKQINPQEIFCQKESISFFRNFKNFRGNLKKKGPTIGKKAVRTVSS